MCLSFNPQLDAWPSTPFLTLGRCVDSDILRDHIYIFSDIHSDFHSTKCTDLLI